MVDKFSAEHYTWGQNCDGWHLVRTPEMSVIQEHMPPHTSEVRHVHAHARQFFFILSGEAVVEVNGEMHRLCAHQGVEIPPQTPHQMMNPSDEGLEFLVVSCPPSHGDRMNI